MPTVILLDVSLSMSRPVVIPDNSEEYTRRHLAIHGINTLLDHLAIHSKLEFVSLVIFSSLWESLVPFTRDYDEIRNALNKLEDYSKTCIETALSSVKALMVEEWGVHAPCQVVLITDGNVGVGPGSLRHSLQTLHQRNPTVPEEAFPLPFSFPCKLQVMCIAPPGDPAMEVATPLYQKLIDVNNGEGELHIPDGALTLTSVHSMFTKLAEKYFMPFSAVLKCGNLSSNVLVHPAPEVYDKDHDFDHVKRSISKTLEICGFLDISDIASPAYISRHLVLPTVAHTDGEEDEGGGTGKEEAPAFTVLLHGSLKVEGMVALVQLADDWFGMMFSWADSKKKSNLMLSVFRPGVDILPWLGNLKHLAPTEDFAVPPYGEDNNKTPFPVRPLERRSYAQNCVVWIKPTGLQADLQKILRNARKLPEKQQHFYKELNRLRRAALSFGFHELLDSTALLLERECTLLPGNAHPDAALQLTHAANALRTPIARELALNIQPLRTNFNAD